MNLKKVVFLVFLLGILWAVPSLAQDNPQPTASDTPLPTPVTVTPVTITPLPNSTVTDVAILVVDVFEEDPATTHPVSNNAYCGSAYDGLDGSHIQGNIITSSLHPYVLAHGRLVYMSFEDVLRDELHAQVTGGLPVGWTSPTQIPSIEQWQTQAGGNIWLVAVDANGYDVNSIAQNIDIAIQAMRATTDRFVINMSFGVVPCQSLPTITPSVYTAFLEAADITCNSDGVALARLRCTIDSLIDNKSDEEVDIPTFVTGLVKYRDSSAVNAATFSFLQQAIAQPLAFQAFNAPIDPPENDIVQQINDIAARNTVNIIQVASAGNDGVNHPYYPANAPNVISVSADYTHGSCPYYRDETKLRHFLNSTLGFSVDIAKDSINRILYPPTNDGEVDENGVSNIPPEVYLKAIYIAASTATATASPTPTPTPLVEDTAAEQEAFESLGCLAGTSFSAPRVSIRMAFHFLATDLIACSGSVDSSTPPLNHPIWDNLSVLEARNRYCHEFRG